ncbi:MAG: TetR/AcrR family transcriptional regulator [Candidatus Nanopelagicales bacterium]
MTVARANASSRGRPRSREADRAITEAALDVLGDFGIANFSVEAVAARAGVGKATIYRRFPGRIGLLSAALDRLHDDLPSPQDEGDARTRLLAHLDVIRVPMSDTRSGRVMAQVISTGSSHPELLEVFYERVISPRRGVLRQTLLAGIEEGWVDADVDIEVVLSLLVGSMMHIKVWSSVTQDAPSTISVLDTALAGIGVNPRIHASGS